MQPLVLFTLQAAARTSGFTADKLPERNDFHSIEWESFSFGNLRQTTRTLYNTGSLVKRNYATNFCEHQRATKYLTHIVHWLYIMQTVHVYVCADL